MPRIRNCLTLATRNVLVASQPIRHPVRLDRLVVIARHEHDLLRGHTLGHFLELADRDPGRGLAPLLVLRAPTGRQLCPPDLLSMRGQP